MIRKIVHFTILECSKSLRYFNKIYSNINKIKVELNILNSLIGSQNIEEEFESILLKYPETLKCIPLLLAVRASEIYAVGSEGEYKYKKKNSYQKGTQINGYEIEPWNWRYL